MATDMDAALSQPTRHVEGLLDGRIVRRHIALGELTLTAVPRRRSCRC